MEVNESSLYGIFCVQAFCQMGCTVLYRILRKNYTYACIQDGLELTVSGLIGLWIDCVGPKWGGCTVLHRILRKNYTYACIQDGLELTVSCMCGVKPNMCL
jgi:hypothetical protein